MANKQTHMLPLAVVLQNLPDFLKPQAGFIGVHRKSRHTVAQDRRAAAKRRAKIRAKKHGHA